MQNLVLTISDKYFALDRRVELLICKSLRTRISLWLLDEAHRAGSDTFTTPLTRAELAAIAARFDDSKVISSDFSDMSGHWAEALVERAAALGWVNGYPDGTFKPDQDITRAEAMTLINNVLDRIPETVADLRDDMHVWPDNAKDAWYYIAVQEATVSHEYVRKSGSDFERWTALRNDPDWSRYNG